MSTTTGPSVSRPASSASSAPEIVAPSPVSQASARSTRAFRSESAAKSGARCGAIVGQPIQPQLRTAGERLGQPHGEPGLAAAEWADDVGQRQDVVERECLAAPRPRQGEADADLQRRSQHARELAGLRWLASSELRAEAVNLLDPRAALAVLTDERGLVLGERALDISE